MKQAIVIIGIGEMGGVFTRGLLRLGHPVYPVTRTMDIHKVSQAVSDPLLVLMAVAEDSLHSALETLPDSWRNRIALLQNELLPQDWRSHHISSPTVISVWFEKKKGQDYKVLIPSPVFGPHAALLESALDQLDIPCWELADEEQLLFELVRKNVYILTTNIAGIVTGGTVGELWKNNEALTLNIANEVIDIQESLTGARFDRQALIQGMFDAFQGDLQHKCKGRSAPYRLRRALAHAAAAGLRVDKLKEIETLLD